MNLWIWILILVVLVASLVGFIIIARKGRALRKNQPLPPPADKAFLLWNQNGHQNRMEVQAPFYFGRHLESNVVLAQAQEDYVVCIFQHNKRFAVQALPGAREFFLNGEGSLASYLWDGDELTIENQKFIFHCY
jgi:hypothetical protein